MNTNILLFGIGLAVGVVVALVGGLLEYILHLRRNRTPRFGVPGCLVYVAGGLILAGVVALIASIVLTGRIGPALIMGAGVLCGFYGGFVVLVLLWYTLWERQSSSREDNLPSDQIRG